MAWTWTYRVVLTDASQEPERTLVKFTTPRISTSGIPVQVQTPYEAGQMLADVRSKKTVNIGLEKGDTDAFRGFVEAYQSKKRDVILDITIIEKDGNTERRYETISVSVQVANVNPTGNGSYVAYLKVTDSGDVLEKDDLQLDYLVALYRELSEKSRKDGWEKDIGNRQKLAEFPTREIQVPPEPLRKALNEPLVGRLFRLIQIKKHFNMAVGEKPGLGESPGMGGQETTDTFYEAFKKKTTLEMSIRLRRLRRKDDTLASLYLSKVLITNYIPLTNKDKGWMASLKVLGNAEANY